MKRILIFLILAATAQGSLTVVPRGVTNVNTSSTTWVISPTTTIAAGSMGVLCMSFDNSGSGGSVKLLTNATINDSVGNVWTRRLDFIYDVGAANAGVEIGVYTGDIVTQLTSAGTLTITFGTANAAKAAVWWEVTPGGGNVVSYITGAASCDGCTSGQTGTAYTVTSSTITVGDVIIGLAASESTSAPGVDSDTTNGAWGTGTETQGTNSLGSMAIRAQYKIQTTTDSTQTYNSALTSADWQAGWIQVREAAPPTPTPTPGPNTGAFLPFFAPGIMKPWFLWKN